MKHVNNRTITPPPPALFPCSTSEESGCGSRRTAGRSQHFLGTRPGDSGLSPDSGHAHRQEANTQTSWRASSPGASCGEPVRYCNEEFIQLCARFSPCAPGASLTNLSWRGGCQLTGEVKRHVFAREVEKRASTEATVCVG